MIGLGSNRLTVCRRGGMSVTQAGRGGMEWLAGGRIPSWASPYSAQATAALKAQFPTQWPTIRAYGIAHPEYVAAINFAAPEDPYIMYSLIPELGKVRKLIIPRGAYIKSGVNMVWGIGVEARLDVDDAAGELWGTGNHVPTYMTAWAIGGNNWRYMGQPISVSAWCPTSSTTLVRQDKTGVYLNGTKKGTYAQGTLTGTDEIWLCGHDSFMKGKSEYWKIDMDGTLLKHYIPCIHGGVAGGLDILGAEWKPNAGSGSFTISESPAS